jgi:hypothetical protein
MRRRDEDMNKKPLQSPTSSTDTESSSSSNDENNTPYLGFIDVDNAIVGCYTHKLTFLNDTQREMLVDAMAEISFQMDMHPETLFVSVQIMDRYFQMLPATKQLVQDERLRVALASLCLASKYMEMPLKRLAVADVVRCANGSCTRAQMVDMEMHVFQTIQYRVYFPTLYSCMEKFYLSSRDVLLKERLLYYSIVCLQDHQLLKYNPYFVVAAIMYMALRCETPDTASQVKQVTGHPLCKRHVFPIVTRIIKGLTQKSPVARNGRVFQAIRLHFRKDQHHRVAMKPFVPLVHVREDLCGDCE